jgi:hypothetical protein
MILLRGDTVEERAHFFSVESEVTAACKGINIDPPKALLAKRGVETTEVVGNSLNFEKRPVSTKALGGHLLVPMN